VEEKYGKANIPNGRHRQEDDDQEDEEGSSSDEPEDEEGVSENEAFEVLETLKAIRSKDPRVYDKKTTFYTKREPDADEPTDTRSKEKPMFLKDYHRQTLLGGDNEEDADTSVVPYAKQQESLKRNLIKEMHDAAEEEEDEDEDGDNFLKPVKAASPGPRPAIPDTTAAEKDPEKFLTDFLASRAWVPSENSRFAALDDDDDDEFDKAEEFELKYNLRFEDPKVVNKTLMSYARDAVAERTVRREEMSSRRRARERERDKKEAEKQEREAERARLRKLKIEEIEEKVKKIRDAAGLSGKEFKIQEWADVLEADWDDDQWDREMSKRFGENYYENHEAADGSGDEEANDTSKNKKKKKKQLEKPEWDDDIDIKDLVPDFDDSDAIVPTLRLTDDDEEAEIAAESSKKNKRSAKAEQKAAQRRDHRIISALVDQNLPLDIAQPGSKVSKTHASFRYRDTSPISFGMTPLDILAATDAQLNEYAGLKKLAAFRDADRKKKDKKRLGKKARLREWRKEAFGSADGPDRDKIFAPLPNVDADVEMEEPKEDAVDIREGERKSKKKKKRSKKGKDDIKMMMTT
jgi:protein KRI1